MPHHRRLRARLLSAAAVAAAVPLALSAAPASAAPRQAAASTTPGAHTPLGTDRTPALPAPPKPPAGLPKQPSGYQAPTALVNRSAPQATAASASGATSAATAAPATPSQARTWGGSGSATTLVLYDTTGTWGWLGEMYAMASGNLASHFGKVTAEPVADYVAGQVNSYTATIYLGSTYNEPLPAATANPTVLRQFADYLYSQHVPFSVGVIPEYTDPNGYYNGGQPQTVTLAQAPAVVSALKYMQSKGGTIIEHGYTHQYSTVANPYNGVTGDDAEFYRAQCSTTQTPPYQLDSPCQNTGWVVWTGPLPGDSSTWAAGRARAGRALFTQAGLAAPTIWETPHYFASAADYAGIDTIYATRYERELFVSGQLSGSAPDYSRVFGQFFPYLVHDVYGEKIIPEDLGNYEPAAENNNPPRTPADIIQNAQVNLAVTQGAASFFFHPTYPLSYLQQIVTGIKSLGYTFVSPTSLSG